MRKPRDFESDLRALNDKAKSIQQRRVQQLGELVIATGASALTIEELAGALLQAANTNDGASKEGWAQQGAGFFQRSRNRTRDDAPDGHGKPAHSGGNPPSESAAGS